MADEETAVLQPKVRTLRWRRCVLTVPACGDTKMEEVCAYCTCMWGH